jgi:ferrochelatase
MPTPYDAVLVLAFGGPEGPDDVRPFLENVLRGRRVPPERIEEVAEHYHHFGGVSPINAQNRALIAALEVALAAHGITLPIYFGNRNWHPFLADTARQMHEAGIRRGLVFVTSAFSSYSGCRQYREDLQGACAGMGADSPVFDKLRVFYNHPGFVHACVARLTDALARLRGDVRDRAVIIFTAHSIPLAMARHAAYTAQLAETAALVAEAVGVAGYRIAYQSRSGPPHVPWLEPDVRDVMTEVVAAGAPALVVHPIGFLSDHMEVLFDLDIEAQQHAEQLGVPFVRAGTVGTHPMFIEMLRLLIAERLSARPERLALGMRGPSHDVCPATCCMAG